MSETIQNRVNDIKDDLELFEDELQKYEYIIDLGKKLDGLDEKDLKDENLVQGCTSQVWLTVEKVEDKLYFKAYSQAQIVRGLIYILINIFSGLSAKEILESKNDILNELNLTEIITANRQSGVTGMIKRIRQYANALS